MAMENTLEMEVFIILRMEEMLHHLGAWNLRNNGLNHLATVAGFRTHPQYLHFTNMFCVANPHVNQDGLTFVDFSTILAEKSTHFL